VGTHWSDMDVDGRRLARLIRFLETKMKKCKNEDKIIRYAQVIGLLIAKKVDVAVLRFDVDKFLKLGRQREKQMRGWKR